MGQERALHACASASLPCNLPSSASVSTRVDRVVQPSDAQLCVVACSGDGFENVMGYRQLIGYDMEASLHNCAVSSFVFMRM